MCVCASSSGAAAVLLAQWEEEIALHLAHRCIKICSVSSCRDSCSLSGMKKTHSHQMSTAAQLLQSIMLKELSVSWDPLRNPCSVKVACVWLMACRRGRTQFGKWVMASLCLAQCCRWFRWQERAQTESTTKTLVLEAFVRGRKRRPGKVGGRQCQQPAGFYAALWEQEAPLEVQTGSAWAPNFLFIEFLP